MMVISLFFSLLIFLLLAAAAGTDPTLFFSGDTTAYLAWLDGSLSKYSKSYFLESSSSNNDTLVEPADGVGLFWTIDAETQTMALAVAARATGWVGFGISEAGGMKGADMVVYETASNTVFDAHVLDDPAAGPVRDDCQNWRLTNSTVDADGGFIVFEVERALDTGDAWDRVFIHDGNPRVPATRVIAAWGDSGTVSYHGTRNRARASIRWFAAQDEVDDAVAFQNAMARDADGSFDLRAVDYPIRRDRVTDYEHFCFSQAELIALGIPADGVHMIGMEPVIDARAHVHHFILYGSTTETNDDDRCRKSFLSEMITGWAPGEGPVALPENVGSPLGGPGGYQSLVLEIHYDNANGVEGVLDSSGVRAYYTRQKRPYELGVLQMGDPLVSMSGEVVVSDDNAEFAQHTFDCPAQCSSIFATQPLTVISEAMHMHGKYFSLMIGAQVRNTLSLNDVTITYPLNSIRMCLFSYR